METDPITAKILAHIAAQAATDEQARKRRSYEMEQSQSGWQFEGVQYRRQPPEETVNFIVSDMGSTLQQEFLGKADLPVLVCGTKPYELGV